MSICIVFRAQSQLNDENQPHFHGMILNFGRIVGVSSESK